MKHFFSTMLVFGWTLVLVPPLVQATDKPNVILIMTDDQGWGSVDYTQRLSPTNGQTFAGQPKLKTPQLSAMAAAGMQFNRFYAAAPVCSPTRASFVTGRHHRRTRVDDANSGHLFNRELTIAEIAKTQGYTTGHFGKWHLGTLDKSVNPRDSNRGGTDRGGSALNYSAPWNHGYDTTFATEAKTNTFDPANTNPPTRYWTGHEQAFDLTDPALSGDDSQVIMNQVLPFIDNAAGNSDPFLATVWFHTPHEPYLPSRRDFETLNEFYPGYDDPNSANYLATAEERGYFASLTAMDREVGRLRAELASKGLLDNTILVFTSDNGTENDAPGESSGDATGGLRANKRSLHEGGVRVPGIIEWGDRIQAGSQTDAIAGVTDLLPTLLDVWDVDLPDDRPLDGESLAPIFSDGTGNTDRTVSKKFHYRTSRSIVAADGRFKAISTNDGSSWQLYDLEADPTESNNLASSNVATLNSLTSEWNAWRADVDQQRSTQRDYDDNIASVSGISINTSNPENQGLNGSQRIAANFEEGSVQSDTPQVFVEQQYATLDEELAVHAGIIAAGTVVDSFLVHFDPEGALMRNFSITFDNEILGVIGSDDDLDASDFLAFANPDFEELRGIEASDSWTINGKTISFSLSEQAGIGLDQLRVITLASGLNAAIVPEPGSVALLSLMASIGGLRRRRR